MKYYETAGWDELALSGLAAGALLLVAGGWCGAQLIANTGALSAIMSIMIMLRS